MSPTTIIEVYPSHLPGLPIERHRVAGTLDDFLREKSPGYAGQASAKFIAYLGDEMLPVERWADPATVGQTIALRCVPREPTFWTAVGQAVLAMAASALLSAALTKKPKSAAQLPTPRELAQADVKANTVRMGQVVPDIAGRVRRYPDYLCQPRRFFISESVQGIDLMLNVGVGEYECDQKQIGETPFEDFGDSITDTLFAPGADVSGHPAHENWYNAPEVGATTGGAGIRLTAGSAARNDTASLQAYIVTGSSIIAPTGAGVLPQDWEAGFIVGISVPNKTISVINGGGVFPFESRDYVRGDFADQNLAAGDLVKIANAGNNDGVFQVESITSTTTPGTPSSVTGVKVAALAFGADPITFSVAGQTVLLDEDYADAAALVAAIDAQIGGLTVSEIDGAIRIVDDSPYDGATVALAGYYDPVFGAAPTHVVGTVTASYDELTLNSWASVPSGAGEGWDGSYTSAWVAATSLWPGEYSGAVLEKIRPVTQEQMVFDPERGFVPNLVYVDTLPRYRIASTISGTLPNGSTGIVGFEFQRLTASGADDPSWAGFSPEGKFQGVTLGLATGNVVGGWMGPFDITPGDELADAIEFDVFAPQGIAGFSKSGNIFAFGVGYEMQYKVNGGDWVSHTYSRVYGTQNQIGWTERIEFAEPARYVKMRMRRTAAERNDNRIIDRLEWYGARARLAARTSYPGWTTWALRITGSDIMSAQSQRQVSLRAQRKLNGVATRGIADYARYVLDSIGYAESGIDVDEFDRLAGIWTARGDTFDFIHAEQLNARDQINRILRAGFAELRASKGLLAPVRDEPRSAEMHTYSMQNMTPDGVLERQFTMPRPDDHDGVDVVYIDDATDTEAVVECRLPGDNGYRALRITADGVRDRTRAWRIGMYERRRMAYRRWKFRWQTELDAFNSDYMDLAAVIDDVPGYGRSGLIRDFVVDGDDLRILATEQFDVPDDVPHVVAWRAPTGRLVGPFTAAAGAEDGEIVALDVPESKRPVIDPMMDPPHIFFGPTSTWRHLVLVTSIRPDGLERVDAQAENYDERVYADFDNEPD